MQRKITESQVFHVIAKALNVVQGAEKPAYTSARIERDNSLRNEILTDFAIMGKVPVLNNCTVIMRPQGFERQWFIMGDSCNIDNNLGDYNG